MSFKVPDDYDDTISLPSTPDTSRKGKGKGFFNFGNDTPTSTPAGLPPSEHASSTPIGTPSASFMGSSLMQGVGASTTHNPFALSGLGDKTPPVKNPFATAGKPAGSAPKNPFAPAPPKNFNEYSEDGEDNQGEGDMWLDMEHDEGDEDHEAGDISDLMMLQTPAADERVFREAEDIFRATSRRSGARRHSFQFATLAKDIYSQSGYASINEPPELILDTERLVTRLYKDGVGPEEDEERLDETLATVTGQITSLWKQYVDAFPLESEEHAAEIGPAPQAPPFEKATYLATLALQVHHTRTGEDGRVTEPLPETLFRWLAEYHNPYPTQVQEVMRCKPCPASHSMFWPTVCMALLRGQVHDAQKLLENAGWESVKANRRGELEYTGRALDNVQWATQDTINMLELCPGKAGNWEIWNNEWTIFRIKTRGALEQLRRFAEGRDRMAGEDVDMAESQQSLTAAARKAESQVPWEIYENLNVIFEIALGAPEVILDTAQDWCEATIGLFGWWDETGGNRDIQHSASQSLMLASQNIGAEGYMERLARCFHTAVASDFHFNSLNPVEVGMACVFEDNAKAVIAILRTWSLPVAAAVAEIASLGRWLPQHQPSALYAFEDLDMEDMEVLGINPTDPDETDGTKDNTLMQYAQELANYKEVSSVEDNSGVTRDGWEVAIHVLGRMDSPQRSEETVGELVENILDEINVDSSDMVDKVWRLLSDLGMVQFAEQVAEHFGDILKETCFRYGEAMWYYALAHRPGKVRDVMHFLIAYSLIQSAAYPPTADMDDYLGRLLKQRNATLERLAKQDLEAAELLGKMLAGYATLRKFYEIRDDESLPLTRRQKSAAAALTMVIASSDDNIRGGLYDASRDAIVGEDFLLALLGEALVFVNHSQREHGSSPLITLEQLDILLKAIEDIQAVGSRVYETCKEFFQLVLASAPALLKGSTPADLMRKSTEKGSMVLSGSSMLASQLHRSVAGGNPDKAVAGPLAPKGNPKRGWDWRSGLEYSTSAEDVLRILRLGLTKDLAKLWLVEADGGML
ncbi:Nucleoporin NUP85 [Cytospora mali]|uniref:Nuclear pore complex protein Nup85 n=1 Tax=Cytospora mali TaxID=578113 RepID=A0A194VFN7_CYTMA|nr:Nucleoporin NUP85 [Valsa mali var. pyri (nom. inval.)]